MAAVILGGSGSSVAGSRFAMLCYTTVVLQQVCRFLERLLGLPLLLLLLSHKPTIASSFLNGQHIDNDEDNDRYKVKYKGKYKDYDNTSLIDS